MPSINQVYQIVNSIANQSLGMTGLTNTNASFVSVGKAVLSSETNKDAWFNTLVDRIGRTVLAVREYRGTNATLKREPFEYGAVLQKISFKMLTASKNTTWNDQDATASNPFDKYSTTVSQKFFDEWSVWEYDSTVPDVQLTTAFTSETQMLAFIDGLFMSAYNALELAYENMSNIARASFMASILFKGGANAINLLALYNATQTTPLTASKCLYDVNFLKFATRQIKLISDRMTRMSQLFNGEAWQRHTPKDLQVVNVLADFGSAVSTYLESDTYHNEMVKLPYYEEVAYWQGSGTDYGFASTSAINVTIPDGAINESTGVQASATVSKAGILATIYDRDAIGVTVDKRRTKSAYNPKDEYTNYFIKAEIGYYRDMSENGVVFYVEDATPSTT